MLNVLPLHTFHLFNLCNLGEVVTQGEGNCNKFDVLASYTVYIFCNP